MASDSTRVPLHRLAHGRAGDKGDTANVSVIAYRPEVLPAAGRAGDRGPRRRAVPRPRAVGRPAVRCCPNCTR